MFEILIGLVALVGGLGVVFALMLSVHWGQKREVGLVPYVFYLIVLSGALGMALSGRDLSVSQDLAPVIIKHPISVWFGRFNSLFILFACSERILTYLLSKNRTICAPRWLVLAMWMYFFTNVVCPALFGRYSTISHELLFMILIGQAAMLFNIKEVYVAIISLRNSLLLFFVLSALCLVVKPHLVLSGNYHGMIPFLTVRYAGLAPHANTFGPLVVLGMLCLWRNPLNNRWMNIAAWTLCLFSMVLSQSKTSWIATLLSVGAIMYWSYKAQIKAGFASVRQPQLPVALMLTMMFCLALGCGLYMFTNVETRVTHYFSNSYGADMMSLTGRDRIWEVAQEEWRRNPVFGYGLEIFNLSFRTAMHFPGAVHAHNQFFQSASSAGWVGVAGLVIYSFVLMYYVLRTARATGGLSVVLFLLLFVLSISEVPLSMTSYATSSLPHLLLLILLAAYAPRRPELQNVGMTATKVPFFEASSHSAM